MKINKKLLYSVVFIFGLSLSIFVFTYIRKHQKPSFISQTPSPTIQPENILLTTYLPNFDYLTREDLPNFSDVRSVYNYKNNKIIIGFNRILEYDPVQKKIIRINNRVLRPSVASGAVLSDKLYFTSSNKNPENNTDRILTQVDLTSGKIIKTYFENPDRSYTNLAIINKGNSIWGSMTGGAFKFDPATEHFTYFDYREMGLKAPSCPLYILNENNVVTVMSNCYDLGYTTYNETTNKWTYRPAESMDYGSKINRQPKDFGLDFPYYLALSNKVHDTYYALTKDSIYIIRRNAFPSRLISISNMHNEYFHVPRLRVNPARTELLISGLNSGPGMDSFRIDQVAVLATIDIKTGKYTNLSDQFIDKTTVKNGDEKNLLYNTLENGRIVDTKGGYIIRNRSNDLHKDCIVSIDMNKKVTVDFQDLK